MTGTTTWMARAASALIIAGAITGCRRSNCTAPADVSGVWGGQVTAFGPAARAELTLVQSGTTVAATYVSGDRIQELRGLRIGRRVEFDSDRLLAPSCPAEIHGTAEFCGEALELTLDGNDCHGPVRARGTLQRANGTPSAAGGGDSSSRAGSGGRTGGGGMPVASAGRGGTVTPTPACAYTNNGRCDEPEGSGLCPDGTDFLDCTRTVRPCAYLNDGECDEPEGTGLCDEGQDPDDCKQAAVCGGSVCSAPDGTPGLPGSGATACCVAGVRCGLTINGGSCFEVIAGVPDASCTNALNPFSVVASIKGCCRPDGLCGLTSPTTVFGCVLPESLGMPFSAAGRIACGSDDFDAGAP